MKARFGEPKFICIALWIASGLLTGSCGRNANSYLDELIKPQEVASEVPPEGLFPLAYFAEAQGQIQQRSGNVDIVFDIDNSGSMDPYIEAVQQNLVRFTSGLKNKIINFQIGVLSCGGGESSDLKGPYGVVKYDDPNLVTKVNANIQQVRNSGGSGYERPLGILLEAVNNPNNVGMFRPDSIPIYFVLTDVTDNDYPGHDAASVTQAAATIMSGLTAFKPQWAMIGIGSPAANPCAGAEDPDQPLLERIVGLTGGKMGRICDADYASLMDKAVEDIATIATEFSISHLIPYESRVTEIHVFVSGVEIPQSATNGFVFNPSRNTISFPGSYVPQKGTIVEVMIEYEEP